MQIQFPAVTLTNTVANRVALPANWAVNDVLLAQVIGSADADFTRIAIGDVVLSARTQLPLVPGQQLTLRVTATGATTTLRLIEPASADAASAVLRGLARVLPQQATVAATQQLLRTLGQLAQAPADVAKVLPAAAATAVLEHLAQVLRALPDPTQLSQAQPLRALIEQAARPTEARVQAALNTPIAPDVGRDLRVLLVRLSDDLAGAAERRPPPPSGRGSVATTHSTAPRLAAPAAPAATTTAHGHGPVAAADFELLKGAIDDVVARFKANQLQSVAATIDAPAPLIIELPITRGGEHDFVHFAFDQERRSDPADDAAPTTVTIKLNLDDGHEFTARLRLTGAVLDLRLGANDAEFNRLLGAHLGELERLLDAHGLTVNPIRVAALTVPTQPRLDGRQLINVTV